MFKRRSVSQCLSLLFFSFQETFMNFSKDADKWEEGVGVEVSYFGKLFFPLSLTDRHKRPVSVSASHGLEKTCCHQPPQPFYLCQRLYKYDVQHVYVTKMIPEDGGYSHCCTHTTLNAEYSGKHRLRIWLNLELKPFI